MISGARYHLEPTCIEHDLFIFDLLSLSFSKMDVISASYKLFSEGFFLDFWLSLIFFWTTGLRIWVLKFFSSWYFLGIDLANPRSQILILQSCDKSIFADLISRCIIFASCKNAIAQKLWYRTFRRWSWVKAILCLISWSTSVPICSITMQNWSILLSSKFGWRTSYSLGMNPFSSFRSSFL